MFKNLKLRTKILLPTLVVVALSLTLVSGLLVKWAGEAAVSEAKVLGRETAERYALDVQGFISPIMDQARAMAGIFEAAVKNDQVIDRDALDQYQLAILEREPSFLGIWTAFIPNGLDARDAEFANTSKMYDSSGRYMPYYFRTNNGIDGHFCDPPSWSTVSSTVQLASTMRSLNLSICRGPSLLLRLVNRTLSRLILPSSVTPLMTL